MNNSFWEWLLEQISKHGYKEEHIQGIFNGKDSLYDLEEFKRITSQTSDDSSGKLNIYPHYLRIYIIDGGIFDYSWMEEYDGEEVYERRIRYVPPFKKVYTLHGYTKTILSVEQSYHNNTVPDRLLGND